MAANIRAMAVFQGASNLPEDRFINTFHFHSPSLEYGTVIEAVLDLVGEFYTSVRSGGNSLGVFLSPYVKRAFTVNGYNLDDPKPRVPTVSLSTLATSVGSGLPEEVAICLSYRGDPPITPRRRGRIYIGPLAGVDTVVAFGTTTTPARPAQASAAQVVPCIIAAAATLMDDANALSTPWSILSNVPSQNFVTITGGYVDNAFDTQRRRGPETSARTQWT